MLIKQVEASREGSIHSFGTFQHCTDNPARSCEGSLLMVPVLDHGTIMGIIQCGHSSSGYFTDEHLEIFTTIANLASPKIKNAIIMERQAIMEAQMRENEKRFRMIVEHAADAIYEINPEGHFSYVNPIFVQRSGYTYAELMRKKFWELVQESQQKEVMEFYIHQIQHQIHETSLEFGSISKSGKLVWVSQNVQARFAEDGRFVGAIVVARDVTERVRYTKQLRLQEDKYRRIISNMDLGLLEVDNDDIILRANPSFSKQSGYLEEELIGSKAQEIFLRNDDSKDFIDQKNTSRTQGVSDRYQIKIVNKAGEDRWWLISGAPNFDLEGNQIGSIGIHLDITDQKELERELEEAKREAEAFAEAKENFLANMSHEIRTPLNAIIGMLRELGKGHLSGKQTQQLYNAQTASQHLLSIISNILDMSKIEAGELHIDQKPFCLHDILEQVLSMFQNQAGQKMIDLQLQVSPEVHQIHVGDAARIRQVLINIVGNAMKFTQDAPITVRCKGEEMASGQQEIHLEIEDHGIGMSQDYVEKLFTQFSQERTPGGQQHGGTGLGMAITKELVGLMGGRIEAHSQKGVGTTIDVFIPLEKGNTLDYIPSYQENAYESLQGMEILLVEDNEMNRAVARATLDHWGLVITEVSNGQLAVDILQSRSFDVILMDLQMPVMGGIDATRVIRQTLQIKTPIIALTANAFKKEIDICIQEGMDGYVTKPFEEQELLNAILEHSDGEAAERGPVPSASEKPTTPSETTEVLYDLSQMVELSRGNEDFVRNMVEMFLEFVEEAVPELKRSLHEGDLPELYVMAHRLKPMVDHMGISSLKQAIRTVEKMAHKGDSDETLENLVEETCEVLQKVHGQLAATL